MRVMTLGGLNGRGLSRRGLGVANRDQSAYAILVFGPLLVLGVIGTLVYLNRRSYR